VRRSLGIALALLTAAGLGAAAPAAAAEKYITDPSGKRHPMSTIVKMDSKLDAKRSAALAAIKGNPRPGVKTERKVTRDASGKLLTTVYHYNTGYQYTAPGTSDGAYSNLSIHTPYLDTANDFHTLAQIWVQSADGQQAQELGWIKSQNVFGDLDPHLFTGIRIHGVFQGWYGTGWNQVSGAAFAPGDTLTVSGTPKRFSIYFFSGVWWYGHDNVWFGYYDDALWAAASPPVTFNTMGLGQTGGEIAAGGTAPCTDMGNGLNGAPSGVTNTMAATSNSWFKYNPSTSPAAPADSLTLQNNPIANQANKYTNGFNSGSVRSFRYGGPGWC
jgi:hypothetical protein